MARRFDMMNLGPEDDFFTESKLALHVDGPS